MERCAGCPFKTNLCGTRGPEDSPFVIVGESPGTRELVSGKPFSGPSGTLIREVLDSAGFSSLDIEPYIINAIDCYPAGKDMKKLITATHACRERVKEQLERYPRKVILALGVAASWSVTGNYGIRITKDRGQVLPSPFAEKGAVITYHPAFLLRNGSALGVWKKDVRQAVKLLKGEELGEWDEPTWHVVTKPSEYSDIVEEYITSGELITGDVETDSFHFMDGRMLCLGITKGDGSHVDIIPENLLYNMSHNTKRLVENGRWNWHNGLFDIKWFRVRGWEAQVDEDTMLLSYALNAERGYHDLDQVAQHWIGAPRHKAMLDQYVKKGESYRVIPPEVLYKYNAIDLSKTHKTWAPLRDAVNEDAEHAKRLYENLLIPAVNFIANMQLYGVEVSEERIRTNIEMHDRELAEVRAKLNVYAQKHLGHDINPNSPKQMQELLYAKMGLGRPIDGTAENDLIQVKRRTEHPIVDIVLDHREIAKRKGTYVSNILADPNRKKNPAGFIKHDGRIHADYKLHATATGRLAGADPNMLNQPRGPLIRGQFVASPGKIFCEVDLNQAELRSLALMSGDPVLMDIYTKNEVSIHDVTTSAFYASKKAIAESQEVADRVRAQLMAGLHVDDDKLYGEAKMRGKAVNFGIVYGREAFSLAREFNIPILEAQRWIDDWLGLYSGAADFIDYCRRAPLENRDLITVFGRKKRNGLVSRDKLRNLQNEFANFPHQSTASDIMLLTAIEVQPVLAARWNAHIWNELYDAIYFECDASDDILQQAVPYIQEVVTRIPRDYGLIRVPFLGDAKIGYDWGHMVDYNPTKDKILDLLGERHT